MVAVVQVNIVVLDVNDNPPIFVNSTYSATLSELVNVGADVETVMAFDRDSVSHFFIKHLTNVLYVGIEWKFSI